MTGGPDAGIRSLAGYAIRFGLFPKFSVFSQPDPCELRRLLCLEIEAGI